jgi:hypothetical protein
VDETWLRASLPKESNEGNISTYIAVLYLVEGASNVSECRTTAQTTKDTRDMSPTYANLVEQAIPSATSHTAAQVEFTTCIPSQDRGRAILIEIPSFQL